MKPLLPLIAGLRPALSIVRRAIALPLFLIGAGLMFVQPCGAVPFETTGSLAHQRFAHTATLLPTGKVLVAGGQDGLRRQNQKSFRSFAFFCNSRRFFFWKKVTENCSHSELEQKEEQQLGINL